MQIQLASGRVETVTSKDLARFDAKVDKSGDHWMWLGSRDKRWGYGMFSMRHEPVLAHVFAHLVAHGPVPAGFVVRHRCDTPGCVRPECLTTGTHQQNAQDSSLRGRCRHQKLSRAQALEIRALRKTGLLLREIASQYGVDRATIGYIVRGDTHVESEM